MNRRVDINHHVHYFLTAMSRFTFIASTPFPSVDQRSGRVEIGLWCRDCAEQTVRVIGQAARNGHSLDIADCLELERRERKAFTEEEIWDHSQTCPGAKSIWTQANVGVGK
jgi:hypothetical protein